MAIISNSSGPIRDLALLTWMAFQPVNSRTRLLLDKFFCTVVGSEGLSDQTPSGARAELTMEVLESSLVFVLTSIADFTAPTSSGFETEADAGLAHNYAFSPPDGFRVHSHALTR